MCLPRVTVEDNGRILHLHSDAKAQIPSQLHAAVYQPGMVIRNTYGLERKWWFTTVLSLLAVMKWDALDVDGWA